MSCKKHLHRICGDKPLHAVDGTACSPDCPKLAVVNRLMALTDGNLTVSFSHDEFLEDDDGASGHLWYAYLDSEIEYLYLDDRKPESMEAQLVAELRRLADLCREMADGAEAKIGELAVV